MTMEYHGFVEMKAVGERRKAVRGPAQRVRGREDVRLSFFFQFI